MTARPEAEAHRFAHARLGGARAEALRARCLDARLDAGLACRVAGAMLEAPRDLADAPGVDVLSDLLRAVRLSGAVFFRAEFSAPWALSSPASALLAQALQLPARHLVLFHCIKSGSCWVELGDGSRAQLQGGEVVVLPFGDPHTMGNGQAPRMDSVTTLFPGPPPWPEPPSLVYGGDGDSTELVCGFLMIDKGLFNPLLSSLPHLVRVHPDASPAGALLRSSQEFLCRELQAASPGAGSVLGRLTELLFVQVLRQHMAQLPERELGWLAALRDRTVRHSLELMHDDPAHPWTVEELARRAAMSRSGFAGRFAELLGEGPVQYLTRWRLQLASQRLRESDDSIAAIARDVGYASEAAFSRAFKREVGHAPLHFRRQAQRAAEHALGPR